MKINKTILVGIIFIIIGGLLFLSNPLDSIIRPVTYLFLMGSSKGKDIMFFALFGLLLVLSQLFKNVDKNKYLKIANYVGGLLLVMGILLEVAFRFQIGIGLNTIFMSVENGISSTSILHTHLLKSILGEILTLLIGPFIDSGINTGVGLYSYVPNIAKIIIILVPIEFMLLVLASQKRSMTQTILLSFFSSCLIIGSIDGGLFSTPAIVGICGILLIYRNGDYIDFFIRNFNTENNISEIKHFARNNIIDFKYLIKRFAPYLLVIIILALRISICLMGAQDEYYIVDVINPSHNIELNDFNVTEVINSTDKTTYIISNEYNEMDLLNDLKIPLKDKCEYYTVSWNFYSYF